MYVRASTPSAGNSLHKSARAEQKAANLRNGNLEALLDLLENLLVLLAANEGNAEALGAESPRATDAVQVRVRLGRQVVVDRQVDLLNVDAATEDVRGNADALVELLELLVTLDADAS
jgi:hypothetical protein